MRSVIKRLQGGDLRSTGEADQVAHLAQDDPTLISALVSGLSHSDPVVKMRCADALEKASRARSGCLQPHARKLRKLLDPLQPKELLWHVLQMIPRIRWRQACLPSLLAEVETCLGHPSSIVRTCALQASADLSLQWPDCCPRVEALLREAAVRGTPAMQSRCRKLLRHRPRGGASLRASRP